jgi:signal transduction histidine kinase
LRQQPPPRARRSLFARLTAAIFLIALGAMLAILVAGEWAVRGARDDALAVAVDTDLAGLADIYATGGRTELVARVRDRLVLTPAQDDAPHYLVADASGVPIAGDIARWPALSAENSEAGYLDLPQGPVFARATLLSPELRLVVAREYASWEALGDRMRLALLTAAALVGLAVMVAGAMAGRRLRRRVLGINEAYQAIERGEIERRAPGADARDELGELAAHANRMLARIEALVKSHRDMSNHVAHELRTPLMHLDNRLLRLVEQQGGQPVPELAAAREEIRGIVRMLDSLLDISASEARRGDASGLEVVDLSGLVGDLAELYEESAADRGLRFVTDIAPGVALPGEAMLLSRMVSNLLDNAFKFVPTGGEIRLSLRVGPVIEIADNGPGIPADMRERIFDRFQRLPATEGKGHGLGLALARAIAERHGLSLRVHDGQPGAIFVVGLEEQP